MPGQLSDNEKRGRTYEDSATLRDGLCGQPTRQTKRRMARLRATLRGQPAHECPRNQASFLTSLICRSVTPLSAPGWPPFPPTDDPPFRCWGVFWGLLGASWTAS